MKFNQLATICFLLVSKVIADVSVSCETVPTNYIDSNAYSTSTTNVVVNGESMIGVFEFYKSVEYVSNCGDVKTTSSSSIGYQQIFK